MNHGIVPEQDHDLFADANRAVVKVDKFSYPVGLYTHGNKQRDDHLYFISNGDGACKIGRTRNLPQRVANLQHASPHALTVELVLPGMGWQERVWHAAFRHHHIRGEWYRCEHDLGQAINAAEIGVEWIAHLQSPEAGVSDEQWRDRMMARSARILRDLNARANPDYGYDIMEWKAA